MNGPASRANSTARKLSWEKRQVGYWSGADRGMSHGNDRSEHETLPVLRRHRHSLVSGEVQGHRYNCRTCHALGPCSEPDRGATARETSDIRTAAAARLWNKRADDDDEASRIIREAAALISSPEFKTNLDRAEERIAELEVALDAYTHGPPAESQQLQRALDRIKELEALGFAEDSRGNLLP